MASADDCSLEPRLTAQIQGLLEALQNYGEMRRSLLRDLGVARSNRDPLAEFSEVLVASLLGGTLAGNRVQKDWDVETPDGQRVQVKYLANPAQGEWPNWHVVKRIDHVDAYALVIFEDLAPTTVHLFFAGDLSSLCAALGKRHARQDRELQFTRGNHLAITRDPDRFRKLGVRVVMLPPVGRDASEESLRQG